jgi:hypothetical protein
MEMNTTPRKPWLKCAMLAGFILLLTSAAAQSEDCVPITDAEELSAMGFGPEAEVNDCTDEDASTLEAADEAAADEAQPQTGPFFSPISAKEFFGREDTTGTSWRYAGGANLRRVGAERFADAQFILPDGTIDFFRWWAFDNIAANIAFFVFQNCQPAFAGGPITINTIVNTTSGTVAAAGHKSNQLTIPAAFRTINNRDCTYLARVRFDAASQSLVLQKVRLQGTAN